MSAVSGSPGKFTSLMDGVDWVETSLGPRASWPASLQAALGIMGDSGFPMAVMWGQEFLFFYNASYAPMLGAKEAWALGRPVREVWPEIWETIGPMLQGVMRTGVATYNEDMQLLLLRNGYPEECYFTFSFSPIAENEEVRGIFCAVAETSAKIIAERRLHTLFALDSRSLAEVVTANPIDLPFSRIYLFDADGRLRLSESSGPPPLPDEAWPVEEAARSGKACVVDSPIAATATLVEPVAVKSALVLPLRAAGMAVGAMVAGLSPFSLLDREYRRFLDLLAARIAGDVAGERARQQRGQNEILLRLLADSVPQIICTAGRGGKLEYFNRRWFEYTGINEAQTFENDGWLNAFHPDDRPAVEAAWQSAAREGSDYSIEARIRSTQGEYNWFLQQTVALRGNSGSVVRLIATATDIDARKRSEEREKFLGHASDVLASSLDVRRILQKITELCVPALADWCQLQTVSAEGELVVEATRHRDPELDARLEALVGRNVVAMRDAAFGSPQVLRSAQSRVLDHAQTLLAVRDNVPDPADRAIYEEAGLGTALIVPMVARGQTRGTLHLVNLDPSSTRSALTVEIAEELARRAALAIDNSRLYEREHRVASALQHAMLPASLPCHPRLELSYAYRPAERESRVGGDWYDAFAVSPNQIAISIGDVAGHGLEASVAMNQARQTLRISGLEGLSPAQTLRRANAALTLSDEHPMITGLYGVIDVERSRFRYSSAGHPPAALAPLAEPARYLKGGGIPLGVDADPRFPMHEIELPPYATLLLYTDGLIEFDRNLEREAARLLEALSDRVQDSGPDGAGALVRCVLNNRQFDDIAVLAATILPKEPGSVEIRLRAEPNSATIARRLVLRYARVAGLGPERSFNFALAAGEAVANAVEHAYRGASGEFVLRIEIAGDGKILGEVRDMGTWHECRPSPERGRGLAILRNTTQRFELNRTPQGTTVRFAV